MSSAAAKNKTHKQLHPSVTYLYSAPNQPVTYLYSAPNQPVTYLYSAPNQPQYEFEIPSQQLPTLSINTQYSGLAAFPWLQYSPELQSVLCYHCAKVTT